MRLDRLWTPIVGGLLALLIVIPTPLAASGGSPTALGANVTFYGRGYGHGVGMSQYGAQGRALAGEDAAAILAHYFQGATLGTVPDTTMIRVLLMSAYAATDPKPLVVVGHDTTWTVAGIAGELPAGAWLSVRPPLPGTTAWRLTATDPATGAVLAQGTTATSFEIAPTSIAGHLEIKTKPSYYDEFRGYLTVYPTAATLSVVNRLPLETYLRGVVPAEMPSTWAPEALAAQAIAARSYAARGLHPTTGTFDVYDDSRSQVYRGVLGEKASTDAAVTATANAVLMSGSSIVNALFHSTGGCATEDNEDSFVSARGKIAVGPVSYLRGSADLLDDGTCADASSPWARWQTKAYPLATVSRWFASDRRTNVGTLTALDLSNRGVSGRLIGVTLIGSLGSKTVSGDVFRAVFNARRPASDPLLRSNLFDVAPLP